MIIGFAAALAAVRALRALPFAIPYASTPASMIARRYRSPVYRLLMGRAAHRTTIACALLLVALGCTSDVLDVDWRLRFDDEADAARTEAVEVCILEGPCPE